MTQIDIKTGQRWIESHPRLSADGPQTVEVIRFHSGGLAVELLNIRTGALLEERYSRFGGARGYRLLEEAP